MGKVYSPELRKRAAAYALKHKSSGKASEVFDVSRASAVRWATQLRQTGKITTGKIGGHVKPLLEGQEDWLKARVVGEPHVSLRKLMAELGERGHVVSYGTVWNFVKRLGLSFKKNRSRRRGNKA